MRPGSMAILDLVWDYRKDGFYIGKHGIPFRFKLRGFLEKCIKFTKKGTDKVVEDVNAIKPLVSSFVGLLGVAVFYLAVGLALSTATIGYYAERWMFTSSRRQFRALFHSMPLRANWEMILFAVFFMCFFIIPLYTLAGILAVVGRVGRFVTFKLV